MTRKKAIGIVLGVWATSSGIVAHILSNTAKKTTYTAELMNPLKPRKMRFYERYVKRVLDIVCASAAITVFSPLYLVVATSVRIKLGSPILFTQDRPGLIGLDGKERIFKMYKFRSMTDERDENGNLMPDKIRLTSFGKKLRATSLDELPEAINILNGTMSVIGPRPQLVRDMVFMSNEQRIRHTAKPGLSGLAQVNGRNNIDWKDKLNWDKKYINTISFFSDIRIVGETIEKALVKREGITERDLATAQDYGDYLYTNSYVTLDEYNEKQQLARRILNRDSNTNKHSLKAIDNKYSVLMSLYNREKPEYLRLALESMLNQTVKPDEIVLVEDGPLTDELYAVLDEYDSYLTRVRSEKNIGLGLALNVGLKVCKNELIARMDTDDISKLDRCEKQLKRFIEKPYLSIVGSHIDEFIGTKENVVSQRRVPLDSSSIYEFAKRRSAFNHPAVMYRKSAVLSEGGYADLKRNQDVELFGRMLMNGHKAENIDETLLYFRSTKELVARRKSWENTKSYIGTIKNFWEMGYSSLGDYLIVMIAQTGMFLLPGELQKWVYKAFLRR